MKQVFFCITLLIGTNVIAQNYWDVKYDGKPVKEEILVEYRAIEKEGPGFEMTQKIATAYYADGSIAKITAYHWDTTVADYIYENEKLTKIIRSDLKSQHYSVSIITEVAKNIFPVALITYSSYDPAIDHYDNESLTMNFTYDRKMQMISERGIFKTGQGNGKFRSEYSYKKGQLKQIISESTSPEGKMPSTDTVLFGFTKANNNGWTERISNNGDVKQERTLVLYSDDELKDPQHLYRPSIFKIDYGQVLKDFYNQFLNERQVTEKWQMSLPQAKRLKILLATAETNPEKYDQYSVALAWLYHQRARYYMNNDQLDLAIQIAKRGIEYSTFKDEEKINKFNKLLKNLYEVKGDTLQAIKYYEPVYAHLVKRGIDIYDYLDVVRFANLHLSAGNLQRAAELVVEPSLTIEAIYEKGKWDDVYGVAYSIMEELATYHKRSGDLLRAQKYLTTVTKYYEDNYGKDDSYQNALESLTSVKKMIILSE